MRLFSYAKSHRRRWIPLLLAAGWLIVASGMTLNDQGTDPRDGELEVHLDPTKVLGSESCEKCHAAEASIWKQTPHHETFQTLHRKPEAQQIASKLGITSFKHDSACIKCHYTMQQSASGLDPISGVSCESCHGAAKDWIAVHNDYGGPGVTRLQETPEHRLQRLRASIAGGMRNPANVYLVAQSCYRCHTVPDEKLVNVGGHKAGSLDFEIVAWSQGKVRHNFVHSDGHSNAVSDPARLRLMFVCGMIADLEFSLRATASATEKATFGVTSAQRAARAAKRLEAAQGKLQQPLLDEALAVFKAVKLRLNNRDQLEQAADKINTIGIRFAATVDGNSLEAIQKYIPTADRWK